MLEYRFDTQLLIEGENLSEHYMAQKGEHIMSLVPYVVEQTNRGERSYDIFSRLLNGNKGVGAQLQGVVLGLAAEVRWSDLRAFYPFLIFPSGGF